MKMSVMPLPFYSDHVTDIPLPFYNIHVADTPYHSKTTIYCMQLKMNMPSSPKPLQMSMKPDGRL